MKESGAIRKKRSNFSMVSNYCAMDDNLSFKAKGLYLVIQAYIDIPNFTLYKSYLMRHAKEGEGAFNSAWKELKDAGYLKQYKRRGDNGSYVYEYELLDSREESNYPDPKNPGVDNSCMENPSLENYGVKNRRKEEESLNNTVYNNPSYQELKSNNDYETIRLHNLMDRWAYSDFHYSKSFEIFAAIFCALMDGKSIELNYTDLRFFIQDLISYNDVLLTQKRFFGFDGNPGHKIIDEIIEVLIDVFQTDPKKKIVVGTHSKSANIVINKMLLLDYEKVNLLIDAIIDNDKEIKNPNAYLKSCLYNAASSQGMTSTYLKGR